MYKIKIMLLAVTIIITNGFGYYGESYNHHIYHQDKKEMGQRFSNSNNVKTGLVHAIEEVWKNVRPNVSDKLEIRVLHVNNITYHPAYTFITGLDFTYKGQIFDQEVAFLFDEKNNLLYVYDFDLKAFMAKINEINKGGLPLSDTKYLYEYESKNGAYDPTTDSFNLSLGMDKYWCRLTLNIRTDKIVKHSCDIRIKEGVKNLCTPDINVCTTEKKVVQFVQQQFASVNENMQALRENDGIPQINPYISGYMNTMANTRKIFSAYSKINYTNLVDIVSFYSTNEYEANKRYYGKRVTYLGSVSQVPNYSNSLDKMPVNFVTVNNFTTTCILNNTRQNLNILRNQSNFIIEGVIDSVSGTMLYLHECKIINTY